MSGRVDEQEIHVHFGDVDYARILYFPRLFHFVHVAMEGFFDRAVGLPYHRLLDERRLGFPTVHAEADYRRPVPYGARLLSRLSFTGIGDSSASFRVRFLEAGPGGLLAEARSTVVCVDMDSFTKRAVPGDLRAAFARYLED